MALGSTQPLSWCVRLTTLPPSCAVVTNSGSLNFLEPSGPVEACNGTALPLPLLEHLLVYGVRFRSVTSTVLLMIYFCFCCVAGTVTLMTGVKYTRGTVTVLVLIVEVHSGFLL